MLDMAIVLSFLAAVGVLALLDPSVGVLVHDFAPRVVLDQRYVLSLGGFLSEIHE